MTDPETPPALTVRAALRALADATGRVLTDSSEASPAVRRELLTSLARAEDAARDALDDDPAVDLTADPAADVAVPRDWKPVPAAAVVADDPVIPTLADGSSLVLIGCPDCGSAQRAKTGTWSAEAYSDAVREVTSCGTCGGSGAVLSPGGAA